jgi:actin-related protein 6
MPRTSKAAAKVVSGPPSTTFVLDNGAYSMKAGFAPNETKQDSETLSHCVVIPNAIARTRDRKIYIAAQLDEEITQWAETTFRRPVEHGQIVNWEAEKEIWDRSFFDEKTAQRSVHIKDPEDTTLILTESPNTIPALQKNADEIIMEEWGFRGYWRTIGLA